MARTNDATRSDRPFALDLSSLQVGAVVDTSSVDKGRSVPHGCFAKGCAWSTCGAAVAASCEDNTIRITDLPDAFRPTGCLVAESRESAEAPSVLTTAEAPNISPATTIHEGGTIYDFAWIPVAESWCIVSATCGHPLHLWDAASGTLRATYRAYNSVYEPATPHCICFTSDPRKLLGGFEGEVRLFDVEHQTGEAELRTPTFYRTTGVQTAKKRRGIQGIVSAVAAAPVSTDVYAAGSFVGQLLLGDLRAKPEEAGFCAGAHGGGVVGLRFSPCGRRLYSSSRKDGAIRVWDTRMLGASRLLVECGGVAPMSRDSPTSQRIGFSLDHTGDYLYSGCRSGVVRCFATSTGEAVHSIRLAQTAVNGVACHPSLPLLAVTTGERRFRVDTSLCELTREVTQHQANDSSSSSSSSSPGSESLSNQIGSPSAGGAESAEVGSASPREPGEKEMSDAAEPLSPLEALSSCDDSVFGCETTGAAAVESQLQFITGRFARLQ